MLKKKAVVQCRYPVSILGKDGRGHAVFFTNPDCFSGKPYCSIPLCISYSGLFVVVLKIVMFFGKN